MPCPPGNSSGLQLFLTQDHLSPKFGLLENVLLRLQRAGAGKLERLKSGECKGSLQNLGQRAYWELYTQPGPFGTPLCCPALQRAHHRFSKWMDECMNDLAGNKMLLPFCHLPTHLWPIALPIRGGDLLVCVLAGSGLWLKYVRWAPICCESRNQSFSLPQNIWVISWWLMSLTWSEIPITIIS